MGQILHTISELLILWLTANLLHGLWIHLRLRHWEKGFVRDPQGVRPGVASYTVGTGPTAVLWLHGFADSPAVFKRVTTRLAATSRFTCRAVRLPGAGETVQAAAQVQLADLEGAILREIAELRNHHAQVWVAGHSMGGALALQTALNPASGVSGVIALAPMIRVSRKRSPVLSPALWFQLANRLFLFSRIFESCFKTRSAAADDPSFVIHRDRFIPFATYCNVFALIDALAPRATHLRVPVFAALPSEDRVVDTPAAQRWFSGVPAPKVIHTLPHLTHVLLLEHGWQHLTDEIASFIEQN